MKKMKNKNKKLKIGIMGGTFNPIHNTHIELAEKVLEVYNLDKVLFITTGQPPHKSNIYIENAYHRHNMVKLAVKNNKKFKASSIEINRNSTTYTIDTLKELHTKYNKKKKKIKLYFITGTDTIAQLYNWKNPNELFNYCKFLVATRPNYNLETNNLNKKCSNFLEKHKNNIKFFEFPESTISSTQIRDILDNKLEVSNLVPSSVLKYIIDNNLYKNLDNSLDNNLDNNLDNINLIQKLNHLFENFLKKYDKIVIQLKSNLTELRFNHSIEVAKEAQKLAMHYNLSDDEIEKAFLAGLLHDCAKCLTKEQIFKEAEIYNFELDDILLKQPDLAHSFLGSFIAQYDYSIMCLDGVKTKISLIDEDVLNAIKYHTTGTSNMFILEKIVYIADYIEPTRKYFDGLEKSRELAYKNLDEAMLFILKSTIEFNKSKNRIIHPLSMEAYNFYNNK